MAAKKNEMVEVQEVTMTEKELFLWNVQAMVDNGWTIEEIIADLMREYVTDEKEFFKSIRKEEKGDGRKVEIHSILLDAGKEGILISEIAERLGITAKNVSSYLSYLRKDNVKIGTKSDGRKFIEE